MSLRVMIADDQEIVRTGLAMILNAQPDMGGVAVAGDGARAVELANGLRPDACLLDVRMPGMVGIEATRRLAVARGRTNAEVAGDLHASLSTVKSHVASLMEKRGVRDRVEIAIRACETGRMRP